MALGGSGTREFVLKVVADVKDATKGLDTVGDSAGGMKSKVLNVGKAVAGGLAVGAVAQFGKASVLAASDAQQSMGAMQSVFGDFAGQMEDFGSTSAESLGITQQEFNQLSATTGSLLKNAGLPMQQVTDSTLDLTGRAADLAAMFGTDVTQAVSAMGSALKGEFDPLESFGVSLKASDVNARALAEGYVDASGNVTDAGKAIAAQEIIMEQSAQAAGTFTEESDTLAGQTQIMTAQMKDAQAQMGSKLLPIIVKVMQAVKPLVDVFAKYADILVPIGIGIGVIVIGLKAYEMGQMAVKAATVVWTAAQWLLNAALNANPIGLIALAIAGLVGLIILLYKKVDWFRAFVDGAIDGVVIAFNWFLDTVKNVWNWIKKNWPLLLAIITGPIGIAVLVISRHWETIKKTVSGAIDAIGRFLGRVWKIITDPFNKAKETISGVLSDIKLWFSRLPGNIASLISGITEKIKAPFRNAFNAIKSLWNNTIGGFGFTVPSWVPLAGGKSFKIPMMAAGGIVTGPTVAMIGESGPEAVIPLGKGLGFGNTTINVYALTANAEVGRKVFEALKEYERTTGKSFA